MLPERWVDSRVVTGKWNHYLALCVRCVETPPLTELMPEQFLGARCLPAAMFTPPYTSLNDLSMITMRRSFLRYVCKGSGH